MRSRAGTRPPSLCRATSKKLPDYHVERAARPACKINPGSVRRITRFLGPRRDIGVAPPPGCVGSGRAMEGAMLKASVWSTSVSRVELDQRGRDARLRLERLERLLVPRAAVTDSWLRQVLCLFSFGIYGEGRQGRRTRRPLSNRRSSRPQIHHGRLEMCGSLYCALGLPLYHPISG